VLLNLPGFPETEQDAENILRFVRSQRDECLLIKDAAEQSVHQRILQLQILQRNAGDSNNVTILGLADLERRREALARAEDTLAAADLRVGAVRTLLRGNALPLVFPNDAEFRGFPPRPHLAIQDGYRSDDSECSVSALSESELRVEGERMRVVQSL
jgi:hypothetical protein